MDRENQYGLLVDDLYLLRSSVKGSEEVLSVVEAGLINYWTKRFNKALEDN